MKFENDLPTLQEVFKNIDSNKLAEMYIQDYVETDVLQNVGHEQVVKKLKWYISWLVHHKVDDNSDDIVMFTSHRFKMSHDNFIPQLVPEFNIQRVSDLGDFKQRYGLEFTPVNEALGYRVALTWKTLHYLYDMLVDVMNELTFFGWKQEGLQKEIDELKKSEHEIDNGDIQDADDVFAALGIKKPDKKKQDHPDAYEYDICHDITKDLQHVWRHSYQKEAKKVKELVKEVDVNVVSA